MLGNMEPRKTNFRFLGNKQVYFSLPNPTGSELLNGQCMRRSKFFCQRGGGGVQAQRRENSLDFLCLFWGFLVQIFRGCGEGSNYLRGGGVQMLISIEFDRTCDLPGMGSGPPNPPPFLWICTCMTFKD